MNKEFGSQLIYTVKTASYIYLHCKIKECKFQSGHTYNESSNGTLCDIKISGKVGAIHRHSIEAHAGIKNPTTSASRAHKQTKTKSIDKQRQDGSRTPKLKAAMPEVVENPEAR